MDKIKRLFNGIKTGLGNLVYFFHDIWSYRDWDGGYMDNLVIKSLESQYKYYSSDNPTQIKDKDYDKNIIKPLRIAIQLLKREDDGFHTTIWHDRYWLKSKSNKDRLELCEKCQQRDYQLAYKIIGRYGRYWWD